MNAETALPAATEHWRPRHHFTPRRNWINDPNGLVYHEGEYHLFYQYNPHGKDWGHMSWGHAVSTDLIHWTELPIAMPEREYMIFSGCAVVDWRNTSGLGDGTAPPLVALYTAFHPDTGRQVQHLAYSHDKGRSWTDHPANPVIDRDMDHFRDPKVFWHAPSGAWVMVVALARAHRIAIYRSPDLIRWQLASEFGPCGWTGGQWECPDLIELPVEGEPGRTVWMLKIDVDANVIGSVNGAQMFFGTFDGHTFTAVTEKALLVDHGGDFYAAQTWSDLPAGHTAPVWIGWMSNHQSGHQYPTHPWRGAMTLPRKLTALRREGEWRLVQRPAALPDEGTPAVAVALEEGRPQILAAGVAQLSGELRFTCRPESRIEITIGAADTPVARLVFDGAHKRVTLVRTAQDWPAPAAFAEPMQACWTGEAPQVQVVFDRLSLEVFIPAEALSLTACFFAAPGAATTIELSGHSLDIRSRGFAPGDQHGRLPAR